MRTQVIPAQVTTVEDKIAGNLNFTQILLLITPVLAGTAVYAIFPPSLSFVAYKLAIVFIFSAICLLLALRIRGMVVISWLAVFSKYAMRPKYYVFDKNDSFQRFLYLPEVSKKNEVISKSKQTTKAKATAKVSIPDLVMLEESLLKGKLLLSFRTARKGGLDVTFNKISKEG